MSDLVAKAKLFAIRARQRIEHRHRYNRQPYEVHLKAVADLVSSVSGDPDMLAAAWLHDIVEDTAVTLNDVEREFGMGVVELVRELTGVSRPGDGSRERRRSIDRSHLASVSSRAKTIKLADLCDTARDIRKHDIRFAGVYLVEMAGLLDVLDEGDPRLVAQAREHHARCQRRVGSAGDAVEPPPSSQWQDDELRAGWKLLNTFTVGDLARPLRCVDEAELQAPSGSAGKAGDPVAIRRGREICGYVAARSGDTTMCASPRRIVREQVIESNAPLAAMVHVLTRYDFAFVKTAGEIDRVLSRTDLEQPIGRMWLFGMVTLIELDFTRRIRARWGERGWEAFLSAGRLEKTHELRAERNRRGQPVELLDCLQLADKGAILAEDPIVLADWGYHSKRSARGALQDLQSLRNHLAHAQALVADHWHQIAGISRRLDDWMTDHAASMKELAQ
jgi:HD domain-containing protein